MINRIKSYFKKELNLNVENSKVLVFKKGRGKKRKEDRMWWIGELKKLKNSNIWSIIFRKTRAGRCILERQLRK